MTSLTGVAWRQIEHLVDKATEDKDGFDLILRQLDQTFKYDDQVEMPRAFERFFYGTSRREGQTLLNYVAEHREALAELEKHEIKLPDKLAGWVLLRRAGLSQEQRQLIQGRAPDFAQRAVTEAMYFLLGQDFKGRSTERTWRGKGYGSTNRWSSRHHGYITEDVYEAEDDETLQDDYDDVEWDEPWDDAFYEDDFNDEMTHHETDIPDETYLEAEQHYEDAFATYLDARRQMAHLKASRGFFPVVALTDGGGSMTSPSMQQAPRSPKSKGRGKSKSKGKSKNKTSTWVNKGGQIPQRANATRCLKCGQVGHWAAHCPQNSSKVSSPARQSPSSSPTSTSPSKKAKGNDGTAMMVRDIARHGPRGVPHLSPLGWFGLQDGGASSVVCGHDVLMRIVDYMVGRGVSIDRFLFMPTSKTFGFGGDASRQADWSVRLPCYIGGRTGYMECFVVEGGTPLLVGRPILQALKLKMDYDTNTMSVNGGPWTPVTKGEKGEFLIQLDDGLENDTTGSNVDFDYVTDETYAAIANHEDLSDYIDIHEYLATTNRVGPEIAFKAIDSHNDEPDFEIPEPPEEDPNEVRKPITEKLVKSLHMNFNKFSKQRRTVVEQALMTHQSGRKVFWEVYSGSANLSHVMAEAGWEVMSFDYNTGWDFTRTDHRRDFLNLLDATCPEFVWLAPPCTVWSSLQNLNIDTPEKQIALQADRDFEENTHLKMCKRAFLKQQREGRHASLEQPKNARSWGTPTLMAVSGHDALFDQCAYGCVLPDENGDYIPIKKSTALRCTDEEMASELTAPCCGGHPHLPIEGTSPGIGSRAAAAGEYQLQMCYYFKHAIENIFKYKGEDALAAAEEIDDPFVREIENMEWPEPSEDSPSFVPDPPEPPKGVLSRLQDEDWQKAKRTVMRLHRNLGHPTKQELVRLLQNKNASSSLIEAAQCHECSLCDLHRRPTGVPVSSMPKDAQSNHRVQADTLWVTIPGQRQQQPVLMISDCTTRLLAARHLLGGEKTEEFIKHLERAWIRNFGPMRVLQVDEHRAWSSDAMRAWCTENGIQLQISPGQSHTRLAILERRHQVTRRALNLFLDGNPNLAGSPDALITALNYVIPQINRTPNACGFSPIQWTLGYTPHIPGLLMEEQTMNNPATLDPSDAFMEKLKLKQEAVKATSEADMDRRLRRALLRKFMGQQTLLNTGDLCYYWRDAPAGSNAKLRWRGPATVIMREAGPSGPNSDVYWLGHGTVLLRAAPEHVKAAQAAVDITEKASDPLVTAKNALHQIRNRGVTHYIDLAKTNNEKTRRGGHRRRRGRR